MGVRMNPGCMHSYAGRGTGHVRPAALDCDISTVTGA